MKKVIIKIVVSVIKLLLNIATIIHGREVFQEISAPLKNLIDRHLDKAATHLVILFQQDLKSALPAPMQLAPVDQSGRIIVFFAATTLFCLFRLLAATFAI